MSYTPDYRDTKPAEVRSLFRSEGLERGMLWTRWLTLEEGKCPAMAGKITE